MIGRLVGCVVMVLVVTGTGCSAADHYRTHHDGRSLSAVMRESVRKGDSVEQVEALLGAGQDDRDRKSLEAMKQMAANSPPEWPDGVKDDDRLVGYPIDDGTTLWLQFRNGKLINGEYPVFLSGRQ